MIGLIHHLILRFKHRDLYQHTAPSVVSLSTRRRDERKQRIASGFVIAPGVICTARHVLDNNMYVRVHPHGGGMIMMAEDAYTIVFSSIHKDVAFIVSDAFMHLPPVVLATHADMTPDRALLHLNLPFNVHSALRLEMPNWGSLMADAPVHVDDLKTPMDYIYSQHEDLLVTSHHTAPGCSGGAVFNAQGALEMMIIQRVHNVTHAAQPDVEYPILTLCVPVEHLVADAKNLGLLL